MSDEIKMPEELEQPAEPSAQLSEQQLKNAAGQVASGETPLTEEELNKVAAGAAKIVCRKAGGTQLQDF